MLFSMMPLLAFAHDVKNGTINISSKYEVCKNESCNYPALHAHNNQPYLPHNFHDGHSYHQQCDLYYCNIGLIHSHNGKIYYPKCK